MKEKILIAEDKKKLAQAVKKISGYDNEEKISLGNITFNKERAVLSNDRANLHLNKKECEMLEYLLNNQDKTIKTKDLNIKLWQDDSKDASTKMYALYLQDKLKALNADVSINKNDLGYQLVGAPNGH